MLNRVTSTFDDRRLAERRMAQSELSAEDPRGRLILLFFVLLCPLLFTAARVVRLQAGVGNRFASEFLRPRIELEVVPARDGRILADDVVLAYDEEQFDVLAHYRWIEPSPAPEWLDARARERLSPANRRRPDILEDSRRAVIEQRRRMWRRLSEMTATGADDLCARREAVVRRVERISRAVNDRRKATLPARANGSGFSELLLVDLESWLVRLRDRADHDPIVVREELDYHRIISGVPLAVAAEIKSRPELFPGLRVIVSTRRVYPHGTLAAHAIGTRTVIRQEELADRRTRYPDVDPFGLTESSRVGRTGVERVYDCLIRGIPGKRRLIRNRRGELIRSEMVRESRPGSDLLLTLNIPLQRRAEQLLMGALDGTPVEAGETATREAEGPARPRPRSGCLVALDVHTGAVRVLACVPAYNLNVAAGGSIEDWNRIRNDPLQPLFPRATQMMLPPGSVFKILTAVALLESGRIDPDQQFECRGYLDEPTRHRCAVFRRHGHGHGSLDFRDAMVQSCNVYFFNAARQIGPQSLLYWANRFGLGQPTGIDLPWERPGQLPGEVPAGPAGGGAMRSRIDTLGFAVGQSRLTATPLQIVRMVAAVANGGFIVSPCIAEQSLMDERPYSPINGAVSRRRIPGLHNESLVRLREALERVVEHPSGTAYSTVRLDAVAVAGKTGTAQVGHGLADHAWFAGYVPADRPRLAFVVVLEHGGSGGQSAGPVAQKFVQALLDTDTIPRRSSAAEVALTTGN